MTECYITIQKVKIPHGNICHRYTAGLYDIPLTNLKTLRIRDKKIRMNNIREKDTCVTYLIHNFIDNHRTANRDSNPHLIGIGIQRCHTT